MNRSKGNISTEVSGFKGIYAKISEKITYLSPWDKTGAGTRIAL